MSRLLSISFGLALLLSSLSFASVPQQISYQGKVTGPGTWADTTVAMTFNVYSDSNGVGSLWTETQSGIAVKSGLFSVQLGKVAPIPSTVFNGAIRWLGVRIGSGSEMRPLTRIVSQPNAYHALSADTATTVVDNAVTSAKIANGTIQFGDIGQNGATAGKIIKWNGSAWALANDSVVAGGNTSGWTDNGAVVSLTNPNDTVGLSGTSTIRFGSGANRITGLTNDLRIVTEDLSVLATEDFTFGKYGMEEWIKFDNLNKRVGIGTLTVDELLHVESDTTGGIAFLKLQTSHATNFGEAGLRVQTPENTWHLRMDDYTHNNLATPGTLALRSGDLGSEVMTWLEDGKVGVGTTAPNQKLHVYGNARVKDTLMATTLTGTFAGTFKANSIDSSKIKDEPGLATVYKGSRALSNSTVVIDSAAITVPAAGYVWAIASGDVWTDHIIGRNMQVLLQVSDNPAGTGWGVEYWGSNDWTSGYYGAPFAVQGVFRVNSAGTYTYYSTGDRTDSYNDDMAVFSHQFTLLYFPTAYGTVELSPAPPLEPGDDLHIKALKQSRLQRSAANETAKPDLATLEARLNALLQEAGNLKSALADMKKE